ncbi:MAG: C40 family peptidase [Candidatus Melainabacteria bacterium]|nr:C40 family peptidase [Candidatus Melainabacteria bacterium]
MSHERFIRSDKSTSNEVPDNNLVPDWAVEYAAHYQHGIYVKDHQESPFREHTSLDPGQHNHNFPSWYRYHPLNPDGDQFRTQRQPLSPNWTSAPKWYQRHNNRFATPSYPYSRYDDVRQTYRYDQDPYWPRMNYTIDSMVGDSIRQYDPRVPENLGCARFVSAVLQRTYGLPITDASVDGLEQSLQSNGFVAMPLSQARPGDIIIAHRAPGKPGHAAIYMGNNEVANNNSFKLCISIDPINKFYAPEYQSVVVYRRLS